MVGDIGDRAFVERALAGADAALLVARADLRSLIENLLCFLPLMRARRPGLAVAPDAPVD